MKFNIEIAKILDNHLPANGVGTEREKLRMELMADLLMVVNDNNLLPVVVGSSLKIPDVKIIVGNAEITFEGKKEVMLSEIAKAYFKIESYLKKNGYHI